MTSIRVDNLRLVYKAPKGVDSRLGGLQLGEVISPISNFRVGRRNSHITALDGVSFSLKSGDRLGIIGSNGSGKTTLLKALYGIYAPTAGSIEIEGNIEALFSIDLGFNQEATGRRNIELRGMLNGWHKKDIAEHMEEVIDFSGLGPFIDLPIKFYSQGMTSRLAFSIAVILVKPDILLMDEWIDASDQEFQEKSRDKIQSIFGNAGISVLATHRRDIVVQNCNKVLKLNKGQVVKFGNIEEFEGLRENVKNMKNAAKTKLRAKKRGAKKPATKKLEQTTKKHKR